MSWDVFLMRVPEGINSMRDLPDDFHPEEIGTPNEVVTIIQKVCPEANFSDDYTGRIASHTIHINIIDNDDGLAIVVAIHVYGEVGETDLNIIKGIGKASGCIAADTEGFPVF